MKTVIIPAPIIERHAAERVVAFVWRGGLCSDDFQKVRQGQGSALSMSPLTSSMETLPHPWYIKVNVIQVLWLSNYTVIFFIALRPFVMFGKYPC